MGLGDGHLSDGSGIDWANSSSEPMNLAAVNVIRTTYPQQTYTAWLCPHAHRVQALSPTGPAFVQRADIFLS